MTQKDAVLQVANILGVEKIAWSRAMKVCSQALKDGFTFDDFIEAARNMKSGDSQYWSIYSVFTKTDYWLSKSQPKTPKGVW